MGAEVWRPIPGWPYEASSLGRIRRADSGRVVSPFNHHGYLRVRLWRDARPKNIGVHRLVALAFLVGSPTGLTVNHIDGDRRNNRPGNLEYLTHAANCWDATLRVLMREFRLPRRPQPSESAS